MSALARSDFAPWSLSEAVVSDFVRQGAHIFEDLLDRRACAELSAAIRAQRRLDASLFLSEAEFAAQAPAGQAAPAPRPRCNLLERLDPRLGFVERAPQVAEALWSLLGPGYRVLDRTIVCELPARALPDWLRRRGHGDPLHSLDAYVRPPFRDLAYRRGADFHQDLISGADRGADFVTLQVYLEPVSEADAPIHLLEGSHRLGAAAFPHDLKRTGSSAWRYRNGRFGEMPVTERVLTGEAGFAALLHPCLLHGTQPNAAERARIALRYRFARGQAANTGLDAVNASIAGPASLAEIAADAPAEPPPAARWNTALKG